MKKKVLIWIISLLSVVAVATATVVIVLANRDKHSHEFSENWSVSETVHWHECECGEKADEGEHTYGAWLEKSPASLHQNKIEKRICTVCGFEETREVGGTQLHNYDLTSWKKDANKHWHECECEAKTDEVSHAFVTEYDVQTGTTSTTVTTTQKCSICGYTTTPAVLQESSYTLVDSASLEGNAKSITEAGVYILTGSFINTTFTIDAANVTLVGTGATTSNLKVNLNENTNNTVLQGLKIQESGAVNFHIQAYGDLTVSKCTFLALWVHPHKKNLNIVFDGNVFTGEYGLYFEYGDTSDKLNVDITNNTFDAIDLYSIFFYSASNQSEVNELNIANNNFINGWGDGETEKRAALKFYMDKNISPVDWGDITDTSKLTEPAKDLVRKILASNNTFDKAGKICSYFNINGIYFDTLDE